MGNYQTEVKKAFLTEKKLLQQAIDKLNKAGKAADGLAEAEEKLRKEALRKLQDIDKQIEVLERNASTPTRMLQLYVAQKTGTTATGTVVSGGATHPALVDWVSAPFDAKAIAMGDSSLSDRLWSQRADLSKALEAIDRDPAQIPHAQQSLQAHKAYGFFASLRAETLAQLTGSGMPEERRKQLAARKAALDKLLAEVAALCAVMQKDLAAARVQAEKPAQALLELRVRKQELGLKVRKHASQSAQHRNAVLISEQGGMVEAGKLQELEALERAFYSPTAPVYDPAQKAKYWRSKAVLLKTKYASKVDFAALRKASGEVFAQMRDFVSLLFILTDPDYSDVVRLAGPDAAHHHATSCPITDRTTHKVLHHYLFQKQLAENLEAQNLELSETHLHWLGAMKRKTDQLLHGRSQFLLHQRCRLPHCKADSLYVEPIQQSVHKFSCAADPCLPGVGIALWHDCDDKLDIGAALGGVLSYVRRYHQILGLTQPWAGDYIARDTRACLESFLCAQYAHDLALYYERLAKKLAGKATSPATSGSQPEPQTKLQPKWKFSSKLLNGLMVAQSNHVQRFPPPELALDLASFVKKPELELKEGLLRELADPELRTRLLITLSFYRIMHARAEQVEPPAAPASSALQKLVADIVSRDHVQAGYDPKALYRDLHVLVSLWAGQADPKAGATLAEQALCDVKLPPEFAALQSQLRKGLQAGLESVELGRQLQGLIGELKAASPEAYEAWESSFQAENRPGGPGISAKTAFKLAKRLRKIGKNPKVKNIFTKLADGYRSIRDKLRTVAPAGQGGSDDKKPKTSVCEGFFAVVGLAMAFTRIEQIASGTTKGDEPGPIRLARNGSAYLSLYFGTIELHNMLVDSGMGTKIALQIGPKGAGSLINIEKIHTFTKRWVLSGLGVLLSAYDLSEELVAGESKTEAGLKFFSFATACLLLAGLTMIGTGLVIVGIVYHFVWGGAKVAAEKQRAKLFARWFDTIGKLEIRKDRLRLRWPRAEPLTLELLECEASLVGWSDESVATLTGRVPLREEAHAKNHEMLDHCVEIAGAEFQQLVSKAYAKRDSGDKAELYLLAWRSCDAERFADLRKQRREIGNRRLELVRRMPPAGGLVDPSIQQALEKLNQQARDIARELRNSVWISPQVEVVVSETDGKHALQAITSLSDRKGIDLWPPYYHS